MEQFLLCLQLLGLTKYSILTLLRRFAPPQDGAPDQVLDWLLEAQGAYSWLQVPEREGVRQADERAASLLAETREQGLKVVGLLSPAYPPRLKSLKASPLLIFSQGDHSLLKQRGISITGARQPAAQGQHICDWLVEEILLGGFTMISSLLLGIDSRSHARNLAFGGRSLALLACGHDQVRPARQQDLADAILAAGGCLVSEQPPGSKLSPGGMQAMRHLISELGRGYIVIEPGWPDGIEIAIAFGCLKSQARVQVPEKAWAADAYELILNHHARLIAEGRAEILDSSEQAARWLAALASSCEPEGWA